jgi:hypothetical protein
MVMTKKYLDRRLFLRGALAAGGIAAIPLPILEGMLNGHGTAYAAGEALPRRFVTWFFGNGVLPPLWIPAATGHTWELSEQLAPLKDVKDYLTVVSGLENKFNSTAFHPAGSAASTTGGPVEDLSAVEPSIDQLIAEPEKYGLPARSSALPTEKKSVALGVCDADPDGPENTLHAVSHRGKNAPNYPEYDPRKAFQSLFGSPSAGMDDAAAKKAADAEKSVLDAVLADASELKPKLSATDQHRLQDHMDAIRQLELTLNNLGTCNAPTDPASQNIGKDTKSEAPQAVSDAVSEMLAIALSCHKTHVASVVFTLPAAHVYYRPLGADMNDDFHNTICHTDAGDNAHQTRVNKGVIYNVQCLATFAKRLQSLTEGAGTLLDNSLVHVTSCTSWGKVHSRDDWPFLFIGKAGGGLAGNLHARFKGENLSKGLFTAAQLMGLDIAKLGRGDGLVTSGLAGLDA